MTIKTDKVNVENGAYYTFVCHKIPFAITCSTELPHGDCNLIDLDLVNKMKIVKLREREGHGVDSGRSLKGHLWMVDGGWWISFP